MKKTTDTAVTNSTETTNEAGRVAINSTTDETAYRVVYGENGERRFAEFIAEKKMMDIFDNHLISFEKGKTFPFTDMKCDLNEIGKVTVIYPEDYLEYLASVVAFANDTSEPPVFYGSYRTTLYINEAIRQLFAPEGIVNRVDLVTDLFNYQNLVYNKLGKGANYDRKVLSLPPTTSNAKSSKKTVPVSKRLIEPSTIKGYDVELLKTLTEVVDEGIIKETIKKMYPNDVWIDADEYMILYSPEDTPVYPGIVLVAHLDTVVNTQCKIVQKKGDENILLNEHKSPAGFDDRAGVVNALLLRQQYRVPIVLTMAEERGGLGAKAFCRTFGDAHSDNPQDYFPIPGTKFLIELDRSGTDYVTYNFLPRTYIDLMSDLDIYEGFGSYSDVCDLTDEFGIPSINLGTGYYDEHTSNETLNVNQWRNQRSSVVPKIMEAVCNIETPIYIAPNSSSYYYGNYYGGTNSYSSYTSFNHSGNGSTETSGGKELTSLVQDIAFEMEEDIVDYAELWGIDSLTLGKEVAKKLTAILDEIITKTADEIALSQ